MLSYLVVFHYVATMWSSGVPAAKCPPFRERARAPSYLRSPYSISEDMRMLFFSRHQWILRESATRGGTAQSHQIGDSGQGNDILGEAAREEGEGVIDNWV
ncbi:hypothetical protein BGX38DRAFT_1175894 [Terfezia claveryi]|nr:hypothetical protein BGX38DRAFT_1175894 [Terfezia claveryi]